MFTLMIEKMDRPLSKCVNLKHEDIFEKLLLLIKVAMR
jgi:hypothetical protein